METTKGFDMWKNKSLQVKVVDQKKEANNAPGTPDIGFESKTKIIGNALEGSIKKIGIAVCGYVILDTIRQVVVNATKPV
jgi:hypothetical protein